uniref:Uncharacterized protein n=1 Tax=Nelumbo nucifera TaxID=4432 RepID=A0A822YBK5_NELNU|nr:TPA_asm: hypothetical protein HUJ06_031170 [Nelumbo nucifera]
MDWFVRVLCDNLVPSIHVATLKSIQYHWKKALKKRQPYKFKWNQYMNKDLRDSYYFNWPVYFP